MGQCLYIRESNNPITVPAVTADLYEIGDICALSAAGNAVTGAAFTWNTDLATTQTDFATAFLGHCYQYKAALSDQVYGNSLAGVIGVSSSGTYEADVQTATTLKVGEFVGLAKDPAGNLLLSQTVVKVATMALAIGVVVEAGVSLTRVKFRLLPSKVPFAR
jgi:hypothetical protein